MSNAIIYCDTKEVNPGDVVTISSTDIANSSSSTWKFENATSNDIEILNQDPAWSYDQKLKSQELVFKCNRAIEPLIIKFESPTNLVLNSSIWETTVNPPQYGDNWETSHPDTQSGDIVVGGGYWGFNGRCQRVTYNGDVFGASSLKQSNIGITTAGAHNLSLRYRSTSTLNINIGSNSIALEATDSTKTGLVYPIHHSAGILSLNADGGGNKSWIFQDGSFSSAEAITKELNEGTSYLLVQDFHDLTISAPYHADIINGDLSDISDGLVSVTYPSSNMTGRISEINHIKECVALPNNIGIRGDINAMADVKYYIDLSDNISINGNLNSLAHNTTLNHVNLSNTGTVGDIGHLHSVHHYVNLSGCDVEGAIAPRSEVTDYIDISDPDTTRVVGNVGSLKSTNTVKLNNTNVNGHVTTFNNVVNWELNNTNIGNDGLEKSLIYMAAYIVRYTFYNGSFKCRADANLATITDKALISTIYTMRFLGWEVDVDFYDLNSEIYNDFNRHGGTRSWWLNYYDTCCWGADVNENGDTGDWGTKWYCEGVYGNAS